MGLDPRPLRAVWVEAAKAGPAPTPRRNDLPADLFDFTGREAECAVVEELLRTAGAVAIDGGAPPFYSPPNGDQDRPGQNRR